MDSIQFPSAPPLSTFPSVDLKRVTALYDYNATDATELSFKAGDSISVLDISGGEWWKGELNGTIGWFPANYVQTGL